MHSTCSTSARATKSRSKAVRAAIAAAKAHDAEAKRRALIPLAALYLPDLPQGPGRAAAPLVWLALMSRAEHKDGALICWPSNATIAKDCGILDSDHQTSNRADPVLRAAVRVVQRALRMLESIGRVSMSTVHRPECDQPGRLITLTTIGSRFIERIPFPSPKALAEIWTRIGQVRTRALTTVSLAVAAYVSTAIVGWASPAALQGLTGSGCGGAFSARLDALCEVGVIERVGGQIAISTDLADVVMLRDDPTPEHATKPNEQSEPLHVLVWTARRQAQQRAHSHRHSTRSLEHAGGTQRTAMPAISQDASSDRPWPAGGFMDDDWIDAQVHSEAV